MKLESIRVCAKYCIQLMLTVQRVETLTLALGRQTSLTMAICFQGLVDYVIGYAIPSTYCNEASTFSDIAQGEKLLTPLSLGVMHISLLGANERVGQYVKSDCLFWNHLT